MSNVTGIARNQVEWIDPRDVVTGMDVNGFQETHQHPRPQQDQMRAESHDADEKAHAEDQRLRWMRIFRRHTEWRLK